MKLWLLRPASRFITDDCWDVEEKGNPWTPWYDKAFGFVVRADTAEEARLLAQKGQGDEANDHWGALVTDCWLNPDYSDCTELLPDGPPEVVLRDFRSA